MGQVVRQYGYKPFGNERYNTAPSGGENVPRRYTGQILDDETGLYYYNARYYDAEIGRFIQADSVLQSTASQGLNRYTYCGNNPLVFTDPSGNEFLAVLAVLLLAGSIASSTYQAERANAGDWYKGFAMGCASAAIGFAGGLIGGWIAATVGLPAIVGGAIGGAMAGALTSAITGGDPAMGALIGAASGALSQLIFNPKGAFKVPKLESAAGQNQVNQLAKTGGTSELPGGCEDEFWDSCWAATQQMGPQAPPGSLINPAVPPSFSLVDPFPMPGLSSGPSMTGSGPVVDQAILNTCDFSVKPFQVPEPDGLWDQCAKWIYTGDMNATDEMYNAAVAGAGDYVYFDQPIREIGIAVGKEVTLPVVGKVNIGVGASYDIDTGSWNWAFGASGTGKSSIGIAGALGNNGLDIGPIATYQNNNSGCTGGVSSNTLGVTIAPNLGPIAPTFTIRPPPLRPAGM